MIVIDASIAVKWVLPEEGSEQAADLLDQDLIAPAFWLAEAANALWRRHRRGEMTASQATSRMVELRNAPVGSSDIEPLAERALSLAVELEHPVYDCLYLALALSRDTHVVTADRHFATVANRPALADRVRFLGTWGEFTAPA